MQYACMWPIQALSIIADSFVSFGPLVYLVEKSMRVIIHNGNPKCELLNSVAKTTSKSNSTMIHHSYLILLPAFFTLLQCIDEAFRLILFATFDFPMKYIERYRDSTLYTVRHTHMHTCTQQISLEMDANKEKNT